MSRLAWKDLTQLVGLQYHISHFQVHGTYLYNKNNIHHIIDLIALSISDISHSRNKDCPWSSPHDYCSPTGNFPLQCRQYRIRNAYAPKPYRVRPERLRAYTTSSAVTVFLANTRPSACEPTTSLWSESYLLACSVYVTESRITCEVSADISAAAGGVTHVLKENLQDTTGLFVNEARDTLDTSTTSKTTNSLYNIRKMLIAHKNDKQV